MCSTFTYALVIHRVRKKPSPASTVLHALIEMLRARSRKHARPQDSIQGDGVRGSFVQSHSSQAGVSCRRFAVLASLNTL
jgi:hypothetical protein